MINQGCKVRPEINNVNSSEPVFYPVSIKTSKCCGSCNNINDPYAKICVPYVAKDLNVKLFNPMSRTNETRHISIIDNYLKSYTNQLLKISKKEQFILYLKIIFGVLI